MHAVWHWLGHVLGHDNVSGAYYAAWSGWVGDLTVIGAVLVYLRHRNCHVRWCLRKGEHPVAGQPWTVCRKHHPDIPNKAPTAEHIAEAANGHDD